jgi:hypothetical protein
MNFILIIILISLIKINKSVNDINNSECMGYYLKYIQPIQNKNMYNVTFEEYIEYWWNREESKEELVDRICYDIKLKYKKNLRNKNIY